MSTGDPTADAMLFSLLAACVFVLGALTTWFYLSKQEYASKSDFKKWADTTDKWIRMTEDDVTELQDSMEPLQDGLEGYQATQFELQQALRGMTEHSLPEMASALEQVEAETAETRSWLSSLAEHSKVLLEFEAVLQEIVAATGDSAAGHVSGDKSARRFAAKMAQLRAFHRSGREDVEELARILAEAARALAETAG